MAGPSSVALLSFALLWSLSAADGSGEVAQVTSIERPPFNESQTCQSCLQIVEHLASTGKPFQQGMAAQESLQIKQACTKLPKDEQQKCQEEIQEIFKFMTGGLAKLNASSCDICRDARLCGPAATAAIQEFSAVSGGSLSSSSQAMPAKSSDADCPMCKFMLTQILAYLKDEKTESKLFGEALKVCEMMGQNQADCSATIDQIGRTVLPLVRDISPEAACHLAQSCAPNDGFPGRLVIPQKIESNFLEWVNGTGLIEDQHGNQCDFCQTLVSEATALLGNPETQHQLLADMKEVCGIFTDFGHQCSIYVQMYGPMAIMTGLGYLQFDTACSDAGFCSPGPGHGQLDLEQQAFTALQEAS